MSMRFPLRLVVMDDDYFALKGAVALLSRDLRTLVTAECDSAESLIQTLQNNKQKPDVLLIDAEYRQTAIPLNALIQRVKSLAPNALVICWSQYGDTDIIRSAVDAGADAVFIKKEVRLAIATDVVRTYRNKRAYTPSVKEILGDGFNEWLSQGTKLEPWQVHPELSPRLKQVFWLCIIYGMSVRAAAAEMQVQPETVERYRMKIYDIIGDGWNNEAYLQEAWERIASTSGEHNRGIDWAFHMITQPPHNDTE